MVRIWTDRALQYISFDPRLYSGPNDVLYKSAILSSRQFFNCWLTLFGHHFFTINGTYLLIFFYRQGEKLGCANVVQIAIVSFLVESQPQIELSENR